MPIRIFRKSLRWKEISRRLKSFSAKAFYKTHICILKKNIQMSMIDYIIEDLTKVSFDKNLFNSELIKCRRWLTVEEWDTLILWVKVFHPDKLDEGIDYTCLKKGMYSCNK